MDRFDLQIVFNNVSLLSRMFGVEGEVQPTVLIMQDSEYMQIAHDVEKRRSMVNRTMRMME